MTNFFYKTGFFFLCVLSITVWGIDHSVVKADYDVECVSTGVAAYIDGVIDNVDKDHLEHAKLLSPIFNMTEPKFTQFATSLATKTRNWDKLDGYAGNAYNMPAGKISDWVSAARSNTPIGDGPLMLTEIGWYPHKDYDTNNQANRDALAGEVAGLKSASNIIAGLIFNVFGNNPDPNFKGQVMFDHQIREVCSGSCEKIGANAAAGFQDDNFYARAKSLGMQYTIVIANNDVSAAILEANRAHANGIKPVFRIGVGESSGGFDDPKSLADFIKQVDDNVQDTFYVIVGPNEPNAESWASPTCTYTGIETGFPITVKGQVFSSIDVGKGLGGVIVAVSEGEKQDGSLILTTEPTQIVETQSKKGYEGYFEIILRGGSGMGGKNYLIFMCGKDVKQVGLIDTSQNFEGLNVYLECVGGQNASEAKTTLEGLPEGKLNHLLRNDFYACSATGDLVNSDDLPQQLFSGASTLASGLLLGFPDHTYEGVIPDTENPPKGTPSNPLDSTSEALYGRGTLSRYFYPIYELVVNHCFFSPCASGVKEALRSETEGEEELPSCEVFKDCNSPVSVTSSDPSQNQKTCGGTATNLADPLMYKAMYEGKIGDHKDDPVCKDGEDPNPVKFGEFETPDIFRIAAPYTPRKDSKYFPYQFLFFGDEKATRLNGEADLKNDSVSSDTPRDRAFDYTDPQRVFSVDGVTAGGTPTEKPKAFKSPIQYILPGGAATLSANAELTIPKSGAVPVTMVSNPTFSDNPEVKKEYSVSSHVVYSILATRSLCICGGFGEARDPSTGACREPQNNFSILSNQLDSIIAPIFKFASEKNDGSVNDTVYGFSLGNFVQQFFKILVQAIRPWGDIDPDPTDPPGNTQCLETFVVGNWATGGDCDDAAYCDAANCTCSSAPQGKSCRTKKIDGECAIQTSDKDYKYTCGSKIYRSLEVNASVPELDPKVIHAANNMAFYFADPLDTNAQFGSTCAYDAEATDQEDKRGLGNEKNCGISSFNYLESFEQSIGDPQFRQVVLKPTKFGQRPTIVPANYNCDPALYDALTPPTEPLTAKALTYFNTYSIKKLTPDLVSVYAQASALTGVPCEVFAGIHSIEGGMDPNKSLISGRPIGTPEPDQGGKVYNTLLETAIDAGNILKGKVAHRGGLVDWPSLINALSWYNGGGNHNCNAKLPNPYDTGGNCPPDFTGEDDPYAMAWIDEKHSDMYLMYCADHTLCNPAKYFGRPGSATIALAVHRWLTTGQAQ